MVANEMKLSMAEDATRQPLMIGLVDAKGEKVAIANTVTV